MSFGINPISAEATRKALVENDRTAAGQNTVAASQAARDADELRELEHSLYYPAAAQPAPTVAGTVPTPSAARRNLIDRLFRRG